MGDLDDLLDPGIKQNSDPIIGQKTLPNAAAVLTLGIISIVGCFLAGLPGIICGVIALSLYPKDKRLYESNPELYADSYKNSKAGFVCAIVGTSLSSLYAIVFLIQFLTYRTFL